MASCCLLNTNELPSALRIAYDLCVLLLRYSGFRLRASALAFSKPLIYKIRKLYKVSILAYYTCRRLSSLVVVK
jgi:hypothetical protein